MTDTKLDALQLGQVLLVQEREASNRRKDQVFDDWLTDHYGLNRHHRQWLAEQLYDSSVWGYRFDDRPSIEEIMDNFCHRIFGASYQEVIDAYDRILG